MFGERTFQTRPRLRLIVGLSGDQVLMQVEDLLPYCYQIMGLMLEFLGQHKGRVKRTTS